MFGIWNISSNSYSKWIVLIFNFDNFIMQQNGDNRFKLKDKIFSGKPFTGRDCTPVYSSNDDLECIINVVHCLLKIVKAKFKLFFSPSL